VGCQVAIVYAVINGYLNGVAVRDVHNFEVRLFEHLENKYQDLLVRFESGYFDPEDVETLKTALLELTR
jgi:F-type H+-transporting ATPase subunit alpha